MNSEQIVKDLSAFGNRATSGETTDKVIGYFKEVFKGKDIEIQNFKTPANYLYIVFFMIIGIIGSLVFYKTYPIICLCLNVFMVINALLYFNWYNALAVKLVSFNSSKNIIVKDKNRAKIKLILMAHWDTAPISFLYTDKMVGGFRNSLIFTLGLLVLSTLSLVLNLFFDSNLIQYVVWTLIAYFVIQLITSSFDFFRLGYSQGASDNATGVAAAISTAQNLWANNLKNIEVELVLTGAEEVGMIGAKAYYDKNKNSLMSDHYVINFDTLGAGDLKIITETGTMNNIVYENELTKKLNELTLLNPELNHVKSGSWHTADFDSVWFMRAGIPTVTLAALDNNGRMPNIHRDTDIIGNVNFKPMHDAIKLATAYGEFLNA